MAIGFTALAMGDSCQLDSAAEGQVLTVRGKVDHAPHDMTFEIPGCDKSVVLVYSEDDGGSANAKNPKNDLSKFRNYTSATINKINGSACLQCPKYQVEATLTGRLSIAINIPAGATKDHYGFLRDSSGKIIGKTGFGHPTPIYKYQLAIQSASDIVARRNKGTDQDKKEDVRNNN